MSFTGAASAATVKPTVSAAPQVNARHKAEIFGMVVSPIYPDRRFNHKDPVLSPPYPAIPLKPKPFLVLHLSKNDDMKKAAPKRSGFSNW